MEKENRPDKSLKLTYSIIAAILAVEAIVMALFAMTHPGYSFPWQTWAIYGMAVLSIIYAILTFVASRLEGADLCTLLILLLTYLALIFFLLSVDRMQEFGKTNWYFPAGMILAMVAYFINTFIRKPQKEAKKK